MQTVKRATATRAVNEDLKDIAQQLIDRIFDALRQTNVHQGTVLDVTSPNEWRHRTREDIEADLAYLEINRAEILSALSDYLADDSLRSGEIDWLFLNVLTYAEYVATVSEIRKRLMGIYKYVKSMQPPISDHVPSISKIASRPWQPFFRS